MGSWQGTVLKACKSDTVIVGAKCGTGLGNSMLETVRYSLQSGLLKKSWLGSETVIVGSSIAHLVRKILEAIQYWHCRQQ